MLRMGAVVLGMEVVAVAMAVLGFGPLVLVVGVPLIVVTVLIVLVAAVSERSRAARHDRGIRAEQARTADPESTVILAPVDQRGLMSGFFEVPRIPEQTRRTAADQVRH